MLPPSSRLTTLTYCVTKYPGCRVLISRARAHTRTYCVTPKSMCNASSPFTNHLRVCLGQPTFNFIARFARHKQKYTRAGLWTHHSWLHRCHRCSPSCCHTSRCEQRTDRPRNETRTVYTSAGPAARIRTTAETHRSHPCSQPVRHTAAFWPSTCLTARRRSRCSCGRMSRRCRPRIGPCHHSGNAGRRSVRCRRQTHRVRTTADLWRKKYCYRQQKTQQTFVGFFKGLFFVGTFGGITHGKSRTRTCPNPLGFMCAAKT